MCGIAGFVSKDILGAEANLVGAKLLRGMVHRGPDGEGPSQAGMFGWECAA